MRLAFAIVAVLVLTASIARAEGQWLDFRTAVLRSLDKVTARVSIVEAPVDGTARLGALEISVRACRKRPAEETPETAAYLVVREVRGEAKKELFKGWMFASSPALSALEHAVYDVWVVDCKTPSKPAKSG